MIKRRFAEFLMAVVCFFGLAVAIAIASCAHVNTPSGFVSCMANPKDEAAALAFLYGALDQDATTVLESAIAAAPDVVRCLLQRTAEAKGAGPNDAGRARKAKAFLDAHPVAGLCWPAGGPCAPTNDVVAGFCIGCVAPGLRPGPGGG